MQTAQGVGVVIAYVSVASAGHFLTTVAKVRERLHLKEVAVDTVPLSIWFWLALGVFTLCLIGTLLYVKEPVETHPVDPEAERLDSRII